MPDRHRHCLSLVLAAVGTACCALAIAACGSSGTKHSGSTGPYGPTNSPAAVSRCMRANGVPNFPDPTSGTGGEGFNGLGVSTDGSMIVDGITFSGPALLAAEKACKQYLPGGNGPPPAIPESRKLAMIADAQCMRRHGIPLPDPTFPESAAKACGGLGDRIGIRLAPR
jgi:hypothetical protein